MSHYKLVANPNCCEACDEKNNHWLRKDVDLDHPVHPNCKCTVIEELSKSEKEAERKSKRMKKAKNEDMSELEQAAMDDPVKEEYYTGFTYVNPSVEGPTGAYMGGLPEVNTTYDFGSTLVQIAPLGHFIGSDAKGGEVKEEITIDSLKNVVSNIGGEILVDVDHASEREGIDRDTSAAAWASDFMVVDGLSDLDNGLYARLRWTEKGRKLVEDRTYRFLSPVFLLDEDSKPLALKSIALTNKPALKGISPIINSEPNATEQEQSKPTTTGHKMDKEICNMCGIEPKGEEVTNEEKAAVMDKLNAWKDAFDKAESKRAEDEAAAKEKEIRNSYEDLIKEYEVEDTDELYEAYKKDADGFGKVLCACGQKKAKNEEPEKEEVKEEVKEEIVEKKEEAKEASLKDDDEVIDREALNSVPVATDALSLKSKAELLHGDAFIDFVRKNKEQLVAEW